MDIYNNASSIHNETTEFTDEFCEEYCPDEQDGSSGSTWASALPLAVQYLLIVLLICFSALFSGLTLGLLGLDTTGLEIIMEGGGADAQAAKAIYPLRKKGNLLLCTFLLGNVAVNALVSILLADKVGGLVGFLGSTGLIVILGEIVPQAFCSRYALYIGSRAIPLVRVIIVLIYPLAAPLAFALDKALGKELATTYSSTEMMELLQIHVREQVLDKDTANAMTGALKYKDMTVSQVMTPLENTFMLSAAETFNFETLAAIFQSGYSRIPVYDDHDHDNDNNDGHDNDKDDEASVKQQNNNNKNVIGLLFVKDLIFLDPQDNIPVRTFVNLFGRGVHVVWPGDKLGDVLRELKQGRSHMALVRDSDSDGDDNREGSSLGIKGIVTLEDIIEEILGHEILDETDAFVDGTHLVKVDRANNAFEMAKLHLLNTHQITKSSSSSQEAEGEVITYMSLSQGEIQAVTSHLRQHDNLKEFVSILTDRQLERFVADTPVTLQPTDTNMYEKGISSNVCTLILSGKVTLITGDDNLRADISSWTLMGIAALNDPNFKPDFTAFVSSSGPCRCLCFTRDQFSAAVDASTAERQLVTRRKSSESKQSEEEPELLSVGSSDRGTATTISSSSSRRHKKKRDDERATKMIAALTIAKEHSV